MESRVCLGVVATQKLNSSLCFVLFHVPVGAGPLIYIVSAGLTGSGQFGTVDLNTGTYQQIGPIEADGYFGLASGPNGSLVAGTYAANLDSIDPATGVPTRIGPTGLESCVIPSSACGSNSFADLGGLNGKIYATDFQNNLYTVNPLTGAATLLNARTGIPAIPFVPGTFNPAGTFNFYDESLWGSGGKLYATFDAELFDLNSYTVVKVVIAPELYQIDPSTAAATVVGATDLGIGGVVDMDGTSYAFNDDTSQITSLDLSSGKTTFVSSFDPGAGVIQGAATVTPEPGSITLAAIALAVLAAVGLLQSRPRRRQFSFGGGFQALFRPRG